MTTFIGTNGDNVLPPPMEIIQVLIFFSLYGELMQLTEEMERIFSLSTILVTPSPVEMDIIPEQLLILSQMMVRDHSQETYMLTKIPSEALIKLTSLIQSVFASLAQTLMMTSKLVGIMTPLIVVQEMTLLKGQKVSTLLMVVQESTLLTMQIQQTLPITLPLIAVAQPLPPVTVLQLKMSNSLATFTQVAVMIILSLQDVLTMAELTQATVMIPSTVVQDRIMFMVVMALIP